MYLKFGIVVLLKTYKELIKVTNALAEEYGRSKFYIALDALWCLFVYGTSFTEYQALNFLNRTAKNKRTFVTVAWLLEQIRDYNPEQYREIFHDKCRFDDTFKDYLGRKYMEVTDTTTDEDIRSFLLPLSSVVIKGSHGCSGKEVSVLNNLTNMDRAIHVIREGRYNLLEEKMVNASVVATLNPTSLNTCRIVTCHGGGILKYSLPACG